MAVNNIPSISIDNSNSTDITEKSMEIVLALVGDDSGNSQFQNSNSVYNQLLPFVNKPDDALDPSPVINNALSELVSILQGNFKFSRDDSTKFSEIAKHASQIIDSNYVLTERAQFICEIASRAEYRLELHYAQRLYHETPINYSSLDESSYSSRIAEAAKSFPYISNYTLMVEQESRIISKMKNTDHIVFCGSGPLPFTGFLLAAHTQATVTLVDNDENAVLWSRKIVEKWESYGVLQSGKVKVIHSDAALLKFGKPGDTPIKTSSSNHVHISCDAVFVAALIPSNVKEHMLKEVSSIGKNGPLVVLRSAHGLTARLAYEPYKRETMEAHLPLLGTVVPIIHAVSNDKPPVVDEDECVPMEWFPSEVLNTLEIYGHSST